MTLRVSWTPTPRAVIRQALQLAKVSHKDTLYDLGCGTGGVLLIATEEFGAKKAIGYENSKERYDLAIRRARRARLRNRISIINRDLLDADLTEASVIFIYLSDKGNGLLRKKFEQECNGGVRVVSHRFKMNPWPIIGTCGEEYTFQTYLYKIPGKKAQHADYRRLNQDGQNRNRAIKPFRKTI